MPMINPRGCPAEHAATHPDRVEQTEAEVRTFADIENGDPEGTLDEMALDAAIL
jgi:hypothetical protein